MSTGVMQRPSRDGLARLTGAFYLGFILAAFLSDALGSIGIGNASGVYEAIRDKPAAFRLGLVVAFVSALLFLLAAWGLYLLLRVVDAGLALLFLLLNAVSCRASRASRCSCSKPSRVSRSVESRPCFEDSHVPTMPTTPTRAVAAVPAHS